jgi:prevent-host-death family protein
MYVTATEMKNNFGKYLAYCKRENVVITKNGKKQAVLLHYPRDYSSFEAGEPIHAYGTSPRQKVSVTYQQFLAMTENSDSRYELIDGEVYMLPSPSVTHQTILGKLHIAFWEYLKEHESCTPFVAPFDVELFRQPLKQLRELNEDDTNVVQPDVMILCDFEKDINEKDSYKGTPDLVVEILSPSTRSKDILKKGDLYMESGVREYWSVDPMKQTVTVYTYEHFEVSDYNICKMGETAASFIFPGLQIAVAAMMGR